LLRARARSIACIHQTAGRRRNSGPARHAEAGGCEIHAAALAKLPAKHNGSSLSGREEARDMLFNRKTENGNDRRPAYLSGSDAPVALSKTDGARPVSVIDETLAIVGDLRTEGDLRLDGHICGNVQCAQLIVGPSAAITGVVTAEEAVIRGRITGTIRAHVVILQGTAHVESDIVYGMLAIDEGAKFEGAVRRSANPLDDNDAASALADLKRMIPGPGDGRAPCAADANGRGAASQGQPRAEAALQGADGRLRAAPDSEKRADG
jgi:cytoskeletal protein CcmA (bactofilin family)